MKPIVILILLLCLSTTVVFGQVKIGDNPQNIDASSVLELESTSQVLVITRITNLQMEAIIPQRGGVVYNTDTQCLHYFNGTEWINLCDAVSFRLTNDPIENITSTISIVDNGGTINLEVAPNSIRSENIVDGGINGDDIQDNSIGESKLGDDSVSANELRQNSVGTSELIDRSIQPIDIANSAPNQVLTTDATGIVNWVDASNVSGVVTDVITITGTGIAGDVLAISPGFQTTVSDNTTSIDEHIVADLDIDDQNEILTNAVFDGNDLVLTESGTETRVNLGVLNNTGTDNQNLGLAANDDLSITGGNTVNLNRYLDNTDTQELSITGNIITISGGNQIPLPAGTVDTDEQDLTLVGTTLNISRGAGVSLEPILLAAADGDETILNEGTNITISGNGTTATPYIINAANGAVADGSETEITEGDNITITGNGTIAAPYIINAEDSVGDGSETEINQGANITITGNGTTATPYIISADASTDNQNAAEVPYNNIASGLTGDTTQAAIDELAGSTLVNTDDQNAGEVPFAPYVTLTGPSTQLAIQQLKDELDDVTLAGGSENPNNELQDIQLAGTVVSLTIPATAGNSIDLDPIFVTETELAAFSVDDGDFDPNNEIELPDDATATVGQILATNVDGTYAWVDDQTATATIVSTDADQILTVGTDSGAFLNEATLDATFATDAEVTTAITASAALDLDIDPNNEIELPDDATATAGQILATNVDGTYAWVDDQTATATIVSTDADQILTVGTDSGAFLNEATLDATFATDAEMTAAITASAALDLDIDPENEIELPDDATATAGQILATNVDGTYAWVDDQTATATIVSTDADQILTVGTDSGALLTEATLNATFATDAEITAAIAASAALDLDIDPENEIELPDDAAATAGQILATDGAGTYNWVDQTGTSGSLAGTVFFADTDLSPTDVGNQFYWDPNGRLAGGLTFGALYIGLDGNTQTGAAKVQIADNAPGLSYALQLSNYSADDGNEHSTGILFSTESAFSNGKGALVYQRSNDAPQNWGRGDFHFLQNTSPNPDNPEITDAVMTIKNNGDVGIGTTTPLANLHVGGNMRLDGSFADKDGESGTPGQVLSSTGTQTDWINAPTGNLSDPTNTGSILFSNGSGGITENNPQLFWNNINNRFGIGTNTPSNKLHVTGAIRSEGVLNSNGTANEPAYRFNSDTNMGMFRIAADQLGFSTNSTLALTIDAGQNIITQGDLSVGGTISTTVSGLVHPDYVFEKYFIGTSALNDNYKFKNLEEIENFIRKNNHLPGIKSTAQVKKDGFWNLSESNIQNLEKIEELFLHTIEQEKKIKALENTNNSMAKEVELLKAQMEEIKKMLTAKEKN